MDFSEIIVRRIVSEGFEENTYIVRRKDQTDCFVIDPGVEPDKIISFLKKNNLQLKAILITHGHGDHIAGVEELRLIFPEAELGIGELDAEKLADPVKNLSAFLGMPLVVPKADRLFQDGEELEIAGIPIQVRLAPGHSKGHVVFLVPCQPKFILFTGDVLFQRSIGRSDFPDGNPIQLIESIRTQLLSLPNNTVVYPGHGESTTIGEERTENPFLGGF